MVLDFHSSVIYELLIPPSLKSKLSQTHTEFPASDHLNSTLQLWLTHSSRTRKAKTVFSPSKEHEIRTEIQSLETRMKYGHHSPQEATIQYTVVESLITAQTPTRYVFLSKLLGLYLWNENNKRVSTSYIWQDN